MAGFDERLTRILDGYANLLQENDLALLKHRPYLVRWVKDFLLFAKEHGGYTFEQTLDLFLAEVGGRVGTKPWQLQQASVSRAVHLLVRPEAFICCLSVPGVRP